MKQQIRWLVTEVFSGAALSARALVVFALFSIPVALVTMPFGLEMDDASAWLTAIAAQLAFTAVALLARPVIAALSPRSARVLRVIVIMFAGAVRGAVLVLGAALATGSPTTGSEYALRATNSAVIAVILLAFIGSVIQYTWNYRAEYALLLERARSLQWASAHSDAELPPDVIAQWINVQRSLRNTADFTRAQLGGDDASAGDFEAAAEVISDVVEHQVRPVSHGLWAVNADEAPRVRPLLVAWDALRPWNPPITAIAITYALIAVLGSITRAGFITGGVFALYVTASVVGVVYLSSLLGRAFPRTRSMGILTLILVPIAVVVVAQLIGQGVLHVAADVQGAWIAGISASILIAGLVFLRRVSIERAILLDQLQARINAQGLDVLAQGNAAEWSRTLGTFVHHSVQSELNAMRLQLMEAATTNSDVERDRARGETIQRLDKLLELQPPWSAQADGRAVIADLAVAWQGIASISLDLTPTGTDSQWQVVAQVVQEGVANAIRSGRARTINVCVQQRETGSLSVVITDDGIGVPDPNNPGLGTWWLDRIAPGAWRRRSTSAGTVLEVLVN